MKSRSQALGMSLTLCLLLAPLAGWGQTSEWKWLTGGNLKAVKFIGQKGWIIGDDGNQGIILHTTNAGDTWAIQPHNTGRHYFRGLSVIDSMNGWIGGGWIGMGEPGFLLRTRDGGRTWTERLTTNAYYLIDVSFVDSLHGWYSTNIDTIYRTTNGGVTWQGFQPDTNRWAFGPINFIDTLRGFAVLPGGIFMVTKTTNGGMNWTTVSDAFISYQLAIDMVDSLNGQTAGSSGVTVHTRDGWRTWQSTSSGSIAILYGVSFGDTLNGWAVGGDNGLPATICNTTNGGVSWTLDSTLTRNNAFYGVDVVDVNTVFVTGAGGGVVKTTNSGNTWTVIRNTDIGAYATFLNVTFRDGNQGWATGTYGVITHTTNGGTVWTRQASGTPNFIYGVTSPTPQRGWVCSDGGEILTTSNAGSTWAFQASNTTYPLFSIDLVDTLFGIAVGGYYGPPEPPGPGIRGQGLGIRGRGIEQVRTGRANYEIASSPRYNGTPRNNAPWGQDTIKPWGTGQDFWKYPWKPEETALTTPYRTITRTTNGGALWIAQNTSGQVPLYGVSFVTPAEGWACGDPQGGMGVILHTTDSGATWTGQSSNVNQALNWIQFRGVQNGWCVGSGGTALWTTDGGTTWNQGNTGVTAPLWSCAFYDNLNGFACGNNGLLIKTTDGGRNWQPDTSKVYANLTGVNALDSTHAWTVGSFGMVLEWRLAGPPGVEQGSKGAGELRVNNGIKAWPNPFVSYARVPGREKEKFALYDVTGRRVGTYKGDRIGADASAGIYFLMAEGKEAGPTRIVKIK